MWYQIRVMAVDATMLPIREDCTAVSGEKLEEVLLDAFREVVSAFEQSRRRKDHGLRTFLLLGLEIEEWASLENFRLQDAAENGYRRVMRNSALRCPSSSTG